MASSFSDPGLEHLYANLMSTAQISRQPRYEDWDGFVERISVTGRINEISEDAYLYFLDVAPPRLFGVNRYCFAEGDEPLRLFWSTEGRYFCRQLTRQESNRLCDASGLPREYGLF
jgi:hypothetical protein